jgi:hypothetical protein
MQLSEEEKQKLRDSGFTEEDIAAYEQDQNQQAAPAPVSPESADSGLPKFSETDVPATTPPPENTYTESALGGVFPAIGEALPSIGGAGGGAVLYGAAKKYGEGKKAELAREELRQSEMMKREQYRQEQLNQRQQMRGQPQLAQAGPRAPVQPGSPGQPAVQGGFQRGQFNMPAQPSMQTGMPSAMNQPPAQPDKMTIFKQPNAGNYIERMSELSKTYGPAQARIQPQPQVQPQAQPQAQPKTSSGFPRGPMRGGGGGGGGGGAMVFDPTQRRKPLQF